MKILLRTLVVLLVSSTLVEAGGIYLAVKPGKTTRDSEKRWHTDKGSYRKDYSESKAIEITVRNNTRIDQTCTVEWFFVAEPLGSGEEWIYDEGSKLIPLRAGQESVFEVRSGEVRARDISVEFANAREKAGGKYDGYLVLVHSGGKVIRTVCSKNSRAYEAKVLEMARELRAEKKGAAENEQDKAADEWGANKPPRNWGLRHRAKKRD